MLILTRKKDESIIIAGHIRVTVVGICGDKVRVGVEADKAISVHREEIQAKIDREASGREGAA